MMWYRVQLLVLLSAVILLASSDGEEVEKEWWKTASVYQIYPRSFKDSDGDGIGDLKGITEALPYLKEIGVDAAWLSPIFKSPMLDFGYDISDFYAIQPEYGTMENFDELVATAKEIGIKIILDFVPNHSSDECEWFQKSLRNEPGFEDFYVWHPGYPDPNNSSNRLPPSNWISRFRNSAWEWREERKEFYLHAFLAEQPDLNFRNPIVLQEMRNVLTFWLDRNVDGFRIDATPFFIESEPDESGRYPDEPVSGISDDPNAFEYHVHIHTQNRPETVGLIYEWRELIDNYTKVYGGDSRILMTETYANVSVVMEYYGNGTHKGSNVPFNFYPLIFLDVHSKAPEYVELINEWMNLMPPDGTANWVLGNHDRSRVATRYGVENADLMNMLLMILPGIVVNYNGEEIGMSDLWISWNDTVDPQACTTNPSVYESYTRDPGRTPFQWDDSKNAGFSTGPTTWLPVNPNFREVNVRGQSRLLRSTLNTYKRAKQFRRKTKTFQHGDYSAVALNENVIGIKRSLANEKIIVMIGNLGSKLERFNLKPLNITLKAMKVAVSSQKSPKRIGDVVNTAAEMMLLPGEALYLQSLT